MSVQQCCLVVLTVSLLACLCPLVASQITYPWRNGFVQGANDTAYEYSWSFGDGSMPVQANESWVSHTYTKPGIYDVSLNDVIIVQGNRTKDSVLTVWACIPEEDRNNPDYTITYSWDFGDNSVDVPQLRRNQVLTHTYNASGSFNVTLKVGLDGDVGTMQETFSSVIKIASATPAPAKKESDDGLSSGDIAGIVTGIIVGVVLVTVGMGMALNYVQQRRKKRNEAINATSTHYELLIEDGV
ncbi:PKD domain containing protein [Acanthamoeba castellanii str. Neff]|uniref:PKD domain containing protein n=1 Tax=Acanthamoeba castellanii (strain ATCC 30010 / Neff) TaxID=1257118 RepID=L8GPB6_ACACF|nr:PKD domain containing protein [Acanthamoeba castellanii str. Neff]ELR14742.1 PKD domain containing protein [Acanthamoeba castellanii str. Neff]